MTRGKNPLWQKDELILCLDLYFQLKPLSPHKGRPEVQELSQLLIKRGEVLSIDGRLENYRSVGGVARKIGNFSSLDPGYDGRGCYHSGQLDREVWDEFVDRPQELKKAANEIRKKF